MFDKTREDMLQEIEEVDTQFRLLQIIAKTLVEIYELSRYPLRVCPAEGASIDILDEYRMPPWSPYVSSRPLSPEDAPHWEGWPDNAKPAPSLCDSCRHAYKIDGGSIAWTTNGHTISYDQRYCGLHGERALCGMMACDDYAPRVVEDKRDIPEGQC